jgi:hypothetical protein
MRLFGSVHKREQGLDLWCGPFSIGGSRSRHVGSYRDFDLNTATIKAVLCSLYRTFSRQLACDTLTRVIRCSLGGPDGNASDALRQER